MFQSESLRVIGRDGLTGTADPVPGDAMHLRVHFDGAGDLLVPREALRSALDGTLYIDLGRADLTPQGSMATSPMVAGARPDIGSGRTAADELLASRGVMIIPVIREELAVEKRSVETGRVRVTREVRERDEIVQEMLLHDRVEVERIPMNQVVHEAPAPRQVGDTLIISVVEETLVVEKRLVVKEEIHIRMAHEYEPSKAVKVTLREDVVHIERTPQSPSRSGQLASHEAGEREGRSHQPSTWA